MFIKFRRFRLYRENVLDYFILSASLIAIFGGLGMILYCLFFFVVLDPLTETMINQAPITQISPYLLFISLIILGFAGIRYFRKEVEF